MAIHENSNITGIAMLNLLAWYVLPQAFMIGIPNIKRCLQGDIPELIYQPFHKTLIMKEFIKYALIFILFVLITMLLSCTISPNPRGIKIVGRPDLILINDYHLQPYKVGDTVLVYFNDMLGEYIITQHPEDELAIVVP